MAYKRKTWQEKLHNNHPEKVEVVAGKFADIPAGSTMYIATPLIVEDYIRHIPPGVSATLQQMRKDLAAEHGAQYTCPITSGIFLRIVAEAAYEEIHAGKAMDEVAPFWRMMNGKSPAIRKLTFSADFVREQREKEGLPF